MLGRAPVVGSRVVLAREMGSVEPAGVAACSSARERAARAAEALAARAGEEVPPVGRLVKPTAGVVEVEVEVELLELELELAPPEVAAAAAADM